MPDTRAEAAGPEQVAEQADPAGGAGSAARAADAEHTDRAAEARHTAAEAAARDAQWPAARLHVVTGKGGTGKTTVAGALALALAADGHRTLVVEVEGRQALAQLFDCPPLPYQERRVAMASGRGEVRALAVDVEEALLDYLNMFYRLGTAGRALKKLGAIDFATTIAPGVRDVLLTGKVKEAVTRRVDGRRDPAARRAYDAVVLDAPPTGRIARFLNVTAETAKLTKVGPIKTQSEGVSAVLRSSLTAVHVVTLLEEMPVQETVDAIAELTGLGLPVGTVMVNGTRPDLLPDGRITQAELRRGLTAAGLPTDRATVSGLAAEAAGYRTRLRLQHRLRADLAAAGRPMLTLPLLPDGVGVSGLHRLAEQLVRQGVRRA